MSGQLTRAIANRQTSSPKTSLGFYATVVGLLLAAIPASIVALAYADAPLVADLITAGVLIVLVTGILLAVVVMNAKVPEKLMLGEITGSQYAEIQQVQMLGDSQSGERPVTVTVEASRPPTIVPVNMGVHAVEAESAVALEHATEPEEDEP